MMLVNLNTEQQVQRLDSWDAKLEVFFYLINLGIYIQQLNNFPLAREYWCISWIRIHSSVTTSDHLGRCLGVNIQAQT
jgi:hypothetical protein